MRNLVGRHLCLHGRLGKARSVRQGPQPHRQLHEHSRRLGLSGTGSQDEGPAQADQGLSAGRQGRPQQSARQLAAGEPGPRGCPAIRGLPLQAGDDRRRPQRQVGRRRISRCTPLALVQGFTAHATSRSWKPSREWEPHPDAVAKDDVPHGTVEQMPPWESKIFASTIRDWSIYVPAQYKPEQPAALMVFQDGERMRDVKGRWRIPVVFDNLIARGDMPPTIAVFINPGNDKIQARAKATGPRIAASNTTAWGIGTPASCWKRSFRRWRSAIAFRPIRRCGRSAAPARAPSVRSPSPGNGPINSARSIRASAASRTCAAAMSIPRSSARRSRSRSASIRPIPAATSITSPEAGGGPISRWRRRCSTWATTRDSTRPKAMPTTPILAAPSFLRP